MIRCDALVAGLGVMGSAATYHLARRGVSVVGLDQYPVPHGHGSSHGETRNIRQAIYEAPEYVPLLLRAFELWQELETESRRSLLRLTGRIMLGEPDGRAIQGARESARRFGLQLDELSAQEVRRRYPTLEPTDEMIGIFEHRAGMLLAEPCVEAQLDLARHHGADLRFEERLVDWRPDAAGRGVVVRTTRGEYSTGQLVLAVGAWLPMLEPALPLAIERQVLLWFEPRDRAESFSPDRFPIYLWELGPDFSIYGVPFWGDGLKVARHHGGETCTVETVRRTVDESDVGVVRAALERYMPAAAGRFLRGRVCVYTNTPDLHFLIARHPESEAVLLVSPCSGHGFKYASAIGEAVAELVTEGRSRLDLSFFQRDRLGS
jgi:sarcosine oxidase